MATNFQYPNLDRKSALSLTRPGRYLISYSYSDNMVIHRAIIPDGLDVLSNPFKAE